MTIRKVSYMAIALLMASQLAACGTVESAKTAKGTGVKRSYAASFNPTWDATICSLNNQGLTILDKNKEQGEITAERGVTAFSWGEKVATFVRAQNAKQTEVEVVSKRVMAVNITAPDWSNKVLDGVSTCMKP